jgi:hypothetical protein
MKRVKPKLTINQTKRNKIENLAESRKWLDLGNIDPYNQPNQTENLEKKYKCGKLPCIISAFLG